MQYINTAYTTYYNVKRKRKGHLFQGRYKSIIVDGDSYFLELTRYIHLNPVKARMVKSPQEYRWTSFHGYMKKKGDGYIDKEQIKLYLDMKTEEYKKFVLEGINVKTDLFKNVYAGFILGSVGFIKDKLKDLKDQVEGEDISYRKSLKGQIEKEDIINAVTRYYKKSLEEICNDKRRPNKEKKITIYLMKKFTDLTNKEIGKFFGMTYSAISKAERNILDLIKQNKDIKREVGRLVSTFPPKADRQGLTPKFRLDFLGRFDNQVAAIETVIKNVCNISVDPVNLFIGQLATNTYDANLTNDGKWAYTYDYENRSIPEKCNGYSLCRKLGLSIIRRKNL